MHGCYQRLLAGGLLLFAYSASLPAAAVETSRSVFSHAAANCQSALPVFDSNIRKRPKALANEGSNTAFITCAFEQTPNALRKVTWVRVIFINRNANDVAVPCTLVDGFEDTQLSPSRSKSTVVSANTRNDTTWTSTDDNLGVGYTFPALSCALPPGVEIAGTGIMFLEDIGS